MAVVSRTDFEERFETFERSAWRLECQGVYHEPEEAEPLRRFLAGESDDLSWFADWPEWVAGKVAAGRRIGRVRVLTEPITGYLRFELERLTPPALEAGEDIRVLPAASFDGLGVPSEDFWLFDDEAAGVLRFGDTGVNGVDEVSEPDRVAEFVDRRERVMAASVSYREWVTGSV